MVSLGSSFSSTTNEIQFYMAFEGVPTTDTSHMTSMLSLFHSTDSAVLLPFSFPSPLGGALLHHMFVLLGDMDLLSAEKQFTVANFN